jgi:GGDEF domain-containing protein
VHDAASFRRRRPRPVADAPVEELVAAADELARDWLLSLLADAPLAEAARVPVAELAAHAPGLCAAMARALASDAELDRLAGGDLAPLAARAGRLAGAPGAPDAAAAIDALRSVLWAAALEALRRPDATLVAELADRLAAVAAAVTAASLRADPLPAPVVEAPLAPPPAPAFEWTAEADAGPVRARDLRPRMVDGGPVELIEPLLIEHAEDRRTLAVVLVELDGIERLLLAQFDAEVDEAVERAELAIEGLLRPGDGARRESAGRLWVALPGTGPAGARALGLRMAAAVEHESHRGAPLAASIGIAVFPVDGTEARTLVDRAEETLYAARATGGPALG